ncbi:MAG TPA: polymer-forming cytoskeletal protein [Verrucomicrobiae bacterium]|nr:polymer-forming cytoskeletal protein [Verrucomicrobiae bacterium]
MPRSSQVRVQVACPHCGHQQPEPPTAYSTLCRKCGGHFLVQEVLNPAPVTQKIAHQKRRITCFECGAELEVPASAESTMCKWCSRYVDLQDYCITVPIAKNFKTKGRFVIEARGNVFNSETTGGDVVIRGKFKGRLRAERSLTIYSSADIKGTVAAARLIIPVENHFAWMGALNVGSVEIGGEFAGDMRVTETVLLRATGRLYGNVEARNVVVEDGAVLIGHLHIGTGIAGPDRRKRDELPADTS